MRKDFEEHLKRYLSTNEIEALKKVEDEVNKDIVTTPTSIRKGIAGNYSGMIGVALLAMERGL